MKILNYVIFEGVHLFIKNNLTDCLLNLGQNISSNNGY